MPILLPILEIKAERSLLHRGFIDLHNKCLYLIHFALYFVYVDYWPTLVFFRTKIWQTKICTLLK